MALVWQSAPRRRKALTQLAYLLVILLGCALEMVLLHHLSPRFFWTDDAQAQFAPQYWWLGHIFNSTGQRVILDPDQGIAGNMLNDPQSGALAPILWVIQSFLALFTNINHASWALACLILLLTSFGLYTVFSIFKIPAWITLSAAVTIPASGFFLWFGSNWWPVMTSGCFLAWGLAAVFSKSRLAVPVVGILLYAIASMGNPYVVPFFLILCLIYWGLLTHRHDLDRKELIGRLLSLAAGIALSVPIYLGTIGSSSVVGRPLADEVFGNSALNVANVWDVLFGSATTLPAMSTWSGALMLAPICATFILSTSLIPLINWSDACHDPKFVTLIIIGISTLIAIQLPSIVGPFRYPFRYLLVWQFVSPLSLLYGFTHYQSRSRTRISIAYGIIALIMITSWSRIPTMLKFHLIWGCAMTITLYFALKLTDTSKTLRKPNRLVAVFSVIVITFCGPIISVQMMQQLNARVSPAQAQPLRETISGYEVSLAQIQDFKDNSAISGKTATVFNFSPSALDRGESSGIFYGNMNLLAGKKTGYGEVAVDQKFLSLHVQRNYVGSLTSAAAKPLLEHAYGSYRWIDLTSSNTLIISANAPKNILNYLNTSPLWRPAKDENIAWHIFHRTAQSPGRISAALNATILQGTASEATLASARTGTYLLKVPNANTQATLVFSSPYWPGYSATWNGHSIPVKSLDKSLVKVQIPAGSGKMGKLILSYKPLAISILLPVTILGLLLLILSVVVARPRKNHLD